jgi:hypothetical protein
VISQNPGYLAVIGAGQLHALVLLLLTGFDYGFALGLIFFSLHLGLLGYLAYRSDCVPKVFGLLLYAASIGYFVDNAGKVLVLIPNYPEVLGTALMAPNLIGEAALMVWLAFRGGKTPEAES